MGWQQVLDDQLDIYRWLSTPQGDYAMRAFEKSYLANNDRFHSKNSLQQVERSKFYLADPMYVSDDMQQVIEAAAESFKPEALRPSDLPTSYGFTVFPRPFLMKDSHEKTVTFRAFAWMPVSINTQNKETGEESIGEGIHISYYSHRDDMLLDDYGKDLGNEWPMSISYSMLHFTPWRFDEEAPTTGDVASHLEWWIIVQTFFRISMQQISDRYQQKPLRASTKRWQREVKTEKDRYITVIRLRRPKHSNNEEPQKVDWKHRWIVEGFWRNQWFPSLNLHRQIYISSYVKGPESKPLLIRKGRVFEVVR